MTPKEKADELVNKFYSKTDEERVLVNKYWSSAKYCALIAVDEIKEALLSILDNDISSIHAIYWEKVKQEIEKL